MQIYMTDLLTGVPSLLKQILAISYFLDVLRQLSSLFRLNQPYTQMIDVELT